MKCVFTLLPGDVMQQESQDVRSTDNFGGSCGVKEKKWRGEGREGETTDEEKLNAWSDLSGLSAPACHSAGRRWTDLG